MRGRRCRGCWSTGFREFFGCFPSVGWSVSAISVGVFLGVAGRVSARRPTYFLMRRQEKVSKEKASRASGPLRGTLRCSKPAGGSETRACGPQTSEPLDPPASALLGPAATAGSGYPRFTRRWCDERRHSFKGCTSVRRVESPPFPPPSCVGESRRVRREKVRRCLSPKGEFLRAPPGPSNAACPQRSAAKGRRIRLAFLCLLSLAKQRK